MAAEKLTTSTLMIWRSLVLLSVAVASLHAAVIRTDFSSSPMTEGWFHHGESELFDWNAGAQNLQVTWDSSKTNSFLYHPLPRYLTRKDDFSAELKLRFHDLEHGITAGKPYTFQIAFGFLNTTNAFNPDFFRGSGVNAQHGSRNLVEFTYFPDSGFGATVGPVIATEKNEMFYAHTFPVELSLDEAFLIKIAFTAADQTLRTTISSEDGTIPISSLVFPNRQSDFVVNAFSIHSYSDAGQNPPQFSGSIRAHASIDDINITLPADPAIRLSATATGGLMFNTEPGWVYGVEHSVDFQAWLQGSADILPPTDPHLFFRVIANRQIVR